MSFEELWRAIAVEGVASERPDLDRKTEENFAFCTGVALGFALGFAVRTTDDVRARGAATLAEALKKWEPPEGALQ